jgi:DNA-directed RNA polymerase specialized sigma subunit
MPKNLLEPDFQEPYKAWSTDPSRANTGQMLKALDPVISTAVRAYAGPSAKSVTIKSQAKRMAAEALSSYDPAKGPLKSHMMSRLQRLRRTASSHRQIIRVPEQVALDQMHSERAANELEDKLGRPPSDQELSDFTGLSLKRLQYIRGSGRPLAESTITRHSDDGGGGYDPRVRSLQERPDAWLELVYDDLDETNQFIIERVLGMHGHPKTKPSQVAAQLRISPAAVSHRMAQIQQKLDKRDTLEML